MPDTTSAAPPQTAATGLPPRYGPPISLAQAKHVMEAAEREASRHGWPMVITTQLSPAHQSVRGHAGGRRHGAQASVDAAPRGAGGRRAAHRAGEVVGAIGVSGMQSGQDGQVAQAGAAALERELG